jgi:alkanesulfonate monooxygenase SsuD/methylene tetrahydromethanopterin reductase-like flavin-dependent oxidoreductase (luciferase family)
MHVGYATLFQNPNNALSDQEVWREEVRMACLAEPLGFDSVWSIEHHFTDYTMCPDPLQFLTYMAAKTERVKLGTMVVVLPWHDPVRVAEQVSMLDTLSEGRLILGLGRGLGRVEYDGFRINMDEGRSRFVEYAELLLEGLERGYLEGGESLDQPKRNVRPFSGRSFKGRTYAAAVSPESMDIMARLGVGLLVIPQKPWEAVKADFEQYHSVWREVNGEAPIPKPLCGGFFFVDENEDRAQELGHKYVSDYYFTAMRHYEMTADHFGQAKGYEFYSQVGKFIDRHGLQGAADDFAKLMPIGTPEQVLDQLQFIRDTIDMNGVMVQTSYAGMPWKEAERNLRCFADNCLPELKKWDTQPMTEAESLGIGIPVGA